MKKVLILLIGLAVLSGCTMDSASLNTKHLIKKNALSGQPATYEAKNVKDALDALPFKLELPKKLPFKSNGFSTITIEDKNHNGKDISSEFSAFSTDSSQLVMVDANNYGATYSIDHAEKIDLRKNVSGLYKGTSVTFKYKDIDYNVTYSNFKRQVIHASSYKAKLINLANQIIQ